MNKMKHTDHVLIKRHLDDKKIMSFSNWDFDTVLSEKVQGFEPDKKTKQQRNELSHLYFARHLMYSEEYAMNFVVLL